MIFISVRGLSDHFFLAETWSFGPTLSLPLFDAGKRAADVELARVQYEAAENKFRSKVTNLFLLMYLSK